LTANHNNNYNNNFWNNFKYTTIPHIFQKF